MPCTSCRHGARPAARSTGDDVLLIADALMRTWGEGKTLSDNARKRLREVNWTGNVRVLESAIKRAGSLSPTSVIEYESLDLRPATMDEQLALYAPSVPCSVLLPHERFRWGPEDSELHSRRRLARHRAMSEVRSP